MLRERAMQILCFSAFEKFTEKVCSGKNSWLEIAFFGVSTAHRQPFSAKNGCQSTQNDRFCDVVRIVLPSKTTAFAEQNDRNCTVKRPLLQREGCAILAHLWSCVAESTQHQRFTAAHSKLAKNRLSNLFCVFRRFSEGRKCKYSALP